ncbi:GTP-binding protein [Prevotella sp. KH2C16]|uniref:GTP-binding protein n=1 Tax=Prevotella sp. KH2C16 TaxID=1855325 RepID=UPI0008EA2EC6|nr:GTP-binding protein [Prevotella sp. KH2C16]SFG64497.1 GTPase, G3E family [Prevotella sp. KH2C16]
MKTKETPVLLLTGYLGSGKTTLLNRILKNERGIKFAVIVNDIGEVNIDASLIEQGGVVGQQDDSLVALQNGCICCTLKMDLVQQLSEIVEMERFDYIVIEASGICEPAPIAQTISAYPQMYPDYAKKGAARLDAIVTIVDALRMRDEFSNGTDLMAQDIGEDDLASLVIQQVEFCNIILLNKAAEVSADDLTRLKSIIRTLQPQAEIVECNYGDVELDKILNTRLFDFEKVATSAKWIEVLEGHDHEEEDEDEDDHDDEEGHHHGHHHEHTHGEKGEVLEYGIDTFVYFRRPALNLGRFDEFVARKWPKSVIRCKGICYFRDEPDTCYVFEQAGRQVGIRNAGQWYATMSAKELEQFMEQNPGLKRDWDERYGDRMQKLVFIGQNLDKDAIVNALDSCLED